MLALATLIAPLLMLAFVFDKCDIWKFGIPIYALLTIGMAIFVVAYQNKSKFFKRIFCYLGKYATNIYIIHLMLSKYWYSTLFYKFQSPCLIFLTLLVSSLILSIVIDYIKEYTGYNKMFNFIVKIILKTDNAIYMIISAVIFAMFHINSLKQSGFMPEISNLLIYFILGMGCAYVYLRTNNILSAIVLHMFWNVSIVAGMISDIAHR